jgi:hypothetical protein
VNNGNARILIMSVKRGGKERRNISALFPIEHYYKNDFKLFKANYFENGYGIKQPLATVNEMMIFLEKQKMDSQNKEKFDKAIEILKFLNEFESDNPL